LGAHIPVPGIEINLLEEYFSKNAGSLLNMFDVFAGGAFMKFSIFALGIMPYISASIILQLLAMVIPALEQLKKEGELGQKKITQYTRVGTVAIAMIQSFGVSMWIKGFRVHDGIPVVMMDPVLFVFMSILTITAGTILLMWMGELITERGISNGISLIIFAGIVCRLPAAAIALYRKIYAGDFNAVFVLMVILIFVGIIAFIVLIEQGQRRIPVQYAQRVIGRKVYGSQNTHIPIKINPAGVMPIIFASSIMMFPAQIASYIGLKFPVFNTVARWFGPDHVVHIIIYGLLIVFFTYFYTDVIYKPDDMAENLKKHGGFIPGIRPGENTAHYFSYVLNRLVLSGAIAVAVIAILPNILNQGMNIPTELAYLMGGTSIMIVVGVDLDLMKHIESHLLMRHYDGLVKSGKMRGRWK
jgi:preprotein translocase subunit SecY